jgi:PBP1b-binding outer membrane lipoprotein LpoB
MKKMIKIVTIVLLLLVFVGCTTHIHNVGNGPQTQSTAEARQWYILWGLVPINEVSTNTMSGNTDDYQIKTEVTPIDILIGIVASVVTVSSRTVTVTK